VKAVTKKPRARTQRRQEERSLAKQARDRERLARLEPGGSAERPIVLESASQVEAHARSLPCARCGADLRVEDHVARVVGEQSLRLVHLSCPSCGAKREVWFRLAPALPN
jgi:hypothetical protein